MGMLEWAQPPSAGTSSECYVDIADIPQPGTVIQHCKAIR